MLVPLTPYESSKTEFSQRTLEFKAVLPASEDEYIQLKQGDIIKELEFQVALGNDSVTTLSLENSYPLGQGKIYLSQENGKFVLDGICKESGPRLFDDYGVFELKQNVPNPFSTTTTITFELPEEGPVKLYVVDLMGVEKVIINENMRKGVYSFYLNADDFNSGIYQYILEMPGRVQSKTFNIIK
jgi:hypothetical protein